MGVKGLWRVISDSGVPVALDSLEGKILAVDISIWLHQAVHGYKGVGGSSVSNAHLLLMFHRICKLLFYRIRPIFVFDGSIPQFKKQTIATRKLRREAAATNVRKTRERLLSNLLKSQAVRNALGKKGPGPSSYHVKQSVKREKDLFELPPINPESDLAKASQDNSELDYKNLQSSTQNLHNFDINSEEFTSMPIYSQHEVLFQLQDTRKENSWDIVNTMPEESSDFSSFQLSRLLKRQKFQETLDDVRNKIKKKHSAELEAHLLVDLEKYVSKTQKIISEDDSHSIFLKKCDAQKEIKETKVENDFKKRRSKSDFLTELAKSGLIDIYKNDSKEANSDEEEFLEDDPLSKSRSELEQEYFLKMMDFVFDNEELSQEEIMTIIKQTKKENSDSTSQQESYFLNDTLCNIEEPIQPGPLMDKASNNEKIKMDSDEKGDNLKAILGAKTNSLYLKIVQQNLNDMITVSDKASVVDTRKGGNFLSRDIEKPCEENITVSFNVDNSCPVEDDLFSDIFTKKKVTVHAGNSNISTSKTCSNLSSNAESNCQKPSKEIVTKSLDIHSSMEDNLFSDIFPKKTAFATTSNLQTAPSSIKKHKNSVGSTTSEVENAKYPSSYKIECPSKIRNVKITNELKEKVNELVKIEIMNLIKDNANSDQSDTLSSKDTSKDKYTGTSSSNVVSNVKNLQSTKNLIHNQEDTFSTKIETSTSCNKLEKISSKVLSTEINNLDYTDQTQNVNFILNEKNETDEENKLSFKEKIFDVYEQKDELNDQKKKCLNVVEKAQQINEIELGSKETIVPSMSDIKENKEKEKCLDISDDSEMYIDSDDSVEDGLSGESNNVKINVISDKNHNEGELYIDSDSSESMESGANMSSGESDDLKINKKSEKNYNMDAFISDSELVKLEDQLAIEQEKLVSDVNTMERLASSISNQMYSDAQQLLRLFGLPYVVAPAEAEAQCAFLELVGLSHGTITDDSDAFLFGGKKVYKHFFNQSKHVEVYNIENVKNQIGLNRLKMIQLALLTGSDYTIGIESVGAVLAMEILSEFPGSGIDCLKNLKKWWNSSQREIELNSTIKQRLKTLYLPESFPSEAIYNAYLKPDVDESQEPFSWALPLENELKLFAMEKFGWSLSKAEETLNPVLKKVKLNVSQTRIDSYFDIKILKEHQHKSERMKKAIAKVKGENFETSQSRKRTQKQTPSQKKKRTQENSDNECVFLPSTSTDTSSNSTVPCLSREERREVNFRKNTLDTSNKQTVSKTLMETRKKIAASILRKSENK